MKMTTTTEDEGGRHDASHFKSYDPPKHDRLVRATTHVTTFEQDIANPVNHFTTTCRGCGQQWTVVPGESLMSCKLCETDLGYTPMLPKEMPT